MTMNKRYRDRPIREIEALVATPILLRQFKIYSKGKSPVAFLSWASASDAVKARVEAGAPLALEDWRSGASLVVVDVVSPFSPTKEVKKRFLGGAKD
jgi:cytolysin-activating lysine-acyltransferase